MVHLRDDESIGSSVLLSAGRMLNLQIPVDAADFLQVGAQAPFCPVQAVGGGRPGLF